MHGWTGTSLLVDVGEGTADPFDRPAIRSAFLGGRGLGVALAAEFGSPSMSPLDPRQPFVLAAGPLTGSVRLSSSRFAAVAPSPLTGTIFDGNAGGRFAVRLRQAGLDALVLTGCAPDWCVVVVDGTGTGGGPPEMRLIPLADLVPEIRPDDPDLVSSRTVSVLRDALGSQFSLLFPSVAGRRGALLGSLRTDDGRNIGRGGLGSVLGGRRVFAVAVAGDRALGTADPDRLHFIRYEAEKQIDANPVTSRGLPQFGTAVLMKIVDDAGALPALNYQRVRWEGVAAFTGESVRTKIVAGRRGCFGCSIRCTPRVGRGSGGREGPEYETLWALGADCGVADLAHVQEANELCGELGLDTISTGTTIACAMELGEAGVLGRGLRFGRGERLAGLIREMAAGSGFGAELADGSARFAARYGYPQTSMHVKGLEMPAYDPRGMHGQGLAYATSNRGACHLRGNMVGPEILGIPKLIDRYGASGKSGILLNLQHLHAIFDSACMCKFAGFAFGEELLARLLSAVTGEPLDAQGVLRTGERIWNLERLWNVAAGFTREDDTLPERIQTEPLTEGPAAGQVVNLPPMLDEYYRARSWEADGIPSVAKVEALGLSAAAEALGFDPESRRPRPGDLPPPSGWRGAAAEGWPSTPTGEVRRLRSV